MARKKFRNQRHEPLPARSFQEYLTTPAPQTSRNELMDLVRGGEDTFLELKVKLSNPERIAQGIVALANTGGGLMVFGVNDNMRVEGVDDADSVRDELVRLCREEVVPPLYPFIDIVAFDNGTRIVALDVEGKRRPYRTRDGRFFVRIGAEKREAARDELSDLLDETRPAAYENLVPFDSEIEDIDEAHLWSFMREFEGAAYEKSMEGYPTEEVLERELMLASAAARGSRLDRVAPTVAGLLLFGRDERVAEVIPRSTVEAVRFAGDDQRSPQVESLRFEGNLHTLFEKALRFVGRYCELWESRPRVFPGSDSPDAPIGGRANYSRGVVAEAIANALSHRDLAISGSTTRLFIFDGLMEIINPRRTSGFTHSAQRAIRYGVTQRLNPQTHALFTSPAYGLQLPNGGLPALLRESRAFSGRKTEIHAFNDEFRLRLYGV